jgi:hypothetical protein
MDVPGRMGPQGTRDAMLTIPSAANWRAYNKSVAQADLGMVWDGMESALESLDDEKRKMLCDRFDAYRELKAGQKQRPKGTKDDGISLADFNRKLSTEGAERNEAINAANRRFWDKSRSV